VLHALLQGKLESTVAEPQRREDALTSTVFGTLVLVEAWELLGEWLQVPAPSGGPDAENECWFWPHLPGGVEPDVVLRLGGTVMVVEAKYRSGRHDLSLDEEYEDKPVDQIQRQHNAVSDLRDQRSMHPDALERAVRECQLRQAFLVDARKIRRARREYHESRERLPDAAKGRFVLVTWQELYGRLLKPEWSRRRWAADLRTYLEECGLASFQGIKRDAAEAGQLTRLSEWRPVPTGLTAPSFDTAAAHLSHTKLGELRHWHPLVNQAKAPTFRIDIALLGNPAIESLRHWHPDLGREEEMNAT
jgi:hypothetical protein